MSESHTESPEPPAPLASGTGAGLDTARGLPWPASALVAGSLGAAFVAVVFLIVDLLSGRPPLWTPAALASALFLGEPAPAPETFEPLASITRVFAYTFLHGAIFVAFGWVAASIVFAGELRVALSLRADIAMGVLLFVAFEAAFFVFTRASDAALVGQLGQGWVAFANAGAAAIMAVMLGRGGPRRES